MDGLRLIGTFPKIRQCGTDAELVRYGKRLLFDIFIYLHMNDAIPEVLASYHNQPSLLLSDHEIGDLHLHLKSSSPIGCAMRSAWLNHAPSAY